jgi:hypothetical protein
MCSIFHSRSWSVLKCIYTQLDYKPRNSILILHDTLLCIQMQEYMDFCIE